MSSPITADNIQTISASSDICSEFLKLANLPTQVKEFLAWMLLPDGTFTPDFYATLEARTMPVGAVIDYAGQNLPSTDWLICNGQEVNIADYPLLYARVGVAYGTSASPSTHFKLPDLRNRVTVAIGDKYTLGQTFGAETHVLTEAELPVVDKSFNVRIVDTEGASGASAYGPTSDPGNFYGFGKNAAATIPFEFGQGVAHNNLQPSFGLYKIIKAK